MVILGNFLLLTFLKINGKGRRSSSFLDTKFQKWKKTLQDNSVNLCMRTAQTLIFSKHMY
jgi:hypothetical protein